MSALSRRGFLTSVISSVRPEAARDPRGFDAKIRYREELGVQRGVESAPRWVPIGRLADFPPGSVVRVNDHKQLLRSLPEGLMAQDATESTLGPVRPLRLEQSGQLLLNPTEAWADGTVLSIMTGSPICLQEEVT